MKNINEITRTIDEITESVILGKHGRHQPAQKTGQDNSAPSSRDALSSSSSSVAVQAGKSFAATPGNALCTRPRIVHETIDAMPARVQAEADRLDEALRWPHALLARATTEKRTASAIESIEEFIAAAADYTEAKDHLNRAMDKAEKRLKQFRADADREMAAAYKLRKDRIPRGGNGHGRRDRGA